MTLEEMLKGIDDFFDEYTLVGNFELKMSYESLWKKWNLSYIPVFKKIDFAEYSGMSSTLRNNNESVFSEDDCEYRGVAA